MHSTMEKLYDIKGNEIKVGDELNLPLDVFSNSIVVLNENGELSLELRYESMKVPLKSLNNNLFNYLTVINEK